MRVDELTLEDRRALVAASKAVDGVKRVSKVKREYLAAKGLRRCSMCWRHLPFAEFNRQGARLQSCCKDCNNLKCRARYVESGGHKNAYYEANRESRLANARAWRAENRGRVRASRARYYAEHREDSWNYDVRARCAAHGVPFEYVTFAALDENIRRHGWSPEHCFYCWVPLTDENRNREHIIPLSDPRSPGGVLSNTVNACGSCNSRKHTTSAEEFLARRARES